MLMTEIILYPTETIYGLGVNALDDKAIEALSQLKQRDISQTMSWLVRDINDIGRYAELSPTAMNIAQKFLPGPLTLVLPAKATGPLHSIAADGTLGFRVSCDPQAQALIETFMAEHNAPLTCTSANVHGLEPQTTTTDILTQFDSEADKITKVLDGGARDNIASTVVRVIDDSVEVLREGGIDRSAIESSI